MRPLVAVVAASLVLAVAVAVSSPALAAQPDDALVEEASQRLAAGDVDAALPLLDQAARQAPKDPRPRYLTGSALAMKGRHADAVKQFAAALALEPKNAAVHNEMGLSLEELRQLDSAIAEFEAATRIKPDLVEAWQNLASARGKKGDRAGAVKALDAAVKANPTNADLRIDLSVAERQAGHAEAALQAANAAVKLAPSSSAARLNLGLTLADASRLDDAAAALGEATRLDGRSATAFWALGDVETKRKRWDAAITALTVAGRLKPSPQVAVALARAYAGKGDVARADKAIADARVRHPRSLAVRLGEVELLAATKRCVEARRALGELPAGQPDVEQTRKEIAATCR